jgi:hypothetical protein
MGCNCKANRQIYELGMRYGRTANATRKDIIKSSVWKWIQYVFLTIFAILASPILFTIIAYRAIVKKDNVLHLDKFIGLNKEKYVGKQQVI